ncbi:hypothetical protein BDR03DRAFT_1049496 [Suillus americanus]|nr:hypothetical protein BDR03DRAFT_1049496 [Suillus americanus]
MPATRQRARRSARLRANACLLSRGMDPPPSTSNMYSIPPSDTGPRVMVQWGKEDALTDILVDHLTSNSADCWILFYSDGKKMPMTDGAKASGKDKSDIYAVIAKLIFANHTKYGPAYHQNPKKFCDSVANHIVGLKTKYKKLKARFSATGAGVLPGSGHANLFAEICSEWKWFADLDGIWHSNPAFAVTSHSSRPGVDHAGQMYSLVQPSCSTAAAHVRPQASGIANAQSTYVYSCPPHHNNPPVIPTAPALRNDPPIDPHLLQHSPASTGDTPSPTPPSHPPQVHLRGIPRIDDDFPMDQADTPPPQNGLQKDQGMQDGDDGMQGDDGIQDGDDGMQDDVEVLNSPPKVVGKKRRIFASPLPSPPPDPEPFCVPAKAPTSTYHSRSAFAHQAGSRRGQHKPPLMSCSMSTPSSTAHNTVSSSSTPQTSLSAQPDAGTKKKKAKSDVQDQLDNLAGEIGSIQSDVMSIRDSKHQ